MSISRDDIFKVLITSLLSLLVYIGSNVLENQKDVSCRLRTLELNQARIMERIGVKPVSKAGDLSQILSENRPP